MHTECSTFQSGVCIFLHMYTVGERRTLSSLYMHSNQFNQCGKYCNLTVGPTTRAFEQALECCLKVNLDTSQVNIYSEYCAFLDFAQSRVLMIDQLCFTDSFLFSLIVICTTKNATFSLAKKTLWKHNRNDLP